jgi:hypothetical protein
MTREPFLCPKHGRMTRAECVAYLTERWQSAPFDPRIPLSLYVRRNLPAVMRFHGAR